ncbi:HpcH/HpaI aldolase/citrate lyase family protein [Sphingomonas sp. MS122]|uniref:HpcH/HpaI aldolase/citrate lyase family protein n=1 Tax=Sphingomonas sp. MS122 TaxID=3412683 RepID=UPI003C2C6506
MRSKLFVPCSRPEFFGKALASAADALSFDLEDSVPADGKAAARERLAAFLGSDAMRQTAKQIIVRVNDPAGPDFAADVEALRDRRIGMINLPKLEEAATVIAAANRITAALDRPVDLLVNIETPRALIRAAEIAGAHPHVAGLQVGLNDLFATLGADRHDPRNVHAALWQIRLGAAGAGVFACDGAWPDLQDEAGFRGEAEMARALGYLGKSCIHPSQIAAANTIFGLDRDLEAARRLVAAARAAALEGRGAFLFEGRMVDRPMIAQAEALLAGMGDDA